MIKHFRIFVTFTAISLLTSGCFAAAPADPNAPLVVREYKAPIRLACVGDSITAGAGTAPIQLQAYPAQLKRIMDEKWDVRNFGSSGSTLMNSGNQPYQQQQAFQKALQFQPDVVVINLGANDTKPQNWQFKEQFVADYKDLIGKFKALESKPRIFICRPVTVPGAGNFGINEAGVQAEIPWVDAIAKDEQTGVIDLHSALAGKDALFPDRVHPNNDGAAVIAKTVYKALTGQSFTGEIPAIAKSQWDKYQRIDFAVDGRFCSLLFPEKAAPGNPWIWRTEFLGTEPQADAALMAKGYHLAYIDISGMYGAPVAIDHMDKFYDFLCAEYKLAPKTVLEGFSRGGLSALNWAARNPDKVASIYLDAPVCDIKSWPGGKGHGEGSPQDWEKCLKAYGLTNEQAMDYKLNPIDNLAPLASVKIPILSVCGDADTGAPMDENTNILEKRYKELGGEIQVITKPGGAHHPHSLKDPTPIVEFILKHP